MALETYYNKMPYTPYSFYLMGTIGCTGHSRQTSTVFLYYDSCCDVDGQISPDLGPTLTCFAPGRALAYVSCSLNSFKGGYIGDYTRDYYRCY